MPSGWTVPTTAETVLRLRVADRVPAREDRAGSAHLLGRSGEDRPEHLGRELLRESGDRQREQRRAAHREHVVEGVRGCDAAEGGRVVDERREEIQCEHERPLVVELVHGCVVRGREPDEQILRLQRNEALQELFEPGRRVLRGAAPADGQTGERSHE